MPDFDSLGVKGGIWSGLLRRSQAPARVEVIYDDETFAQAQVSAAGEGVWRIEAPVPARLLADAPKSLLLVGKNADSSEQVERLANLSIVAGHSTDLDLHAEIDLIRAELDLLKREFRRLAKA